MDYKNGINAVLVYTEKGRDLFKRTDLDMVLTTYEDVLAGNPFLEKVISVDTKKRKTFQNSVSQMSLLKAFNYSCYGPIYRRIIYRIYEILRYAVGRFIRRIGLKHKIV